MISRVCCLQASHLETETISYEEKEQQLVNDCVKELREYWTDGGRNVYHPPSLPLSLWGHWFLYGSESHFWSQHMLMFSGNSNLQISTLSEELARKSDDASRQQEEITHLLSQIVDLQKKAKLVRNISYC